MPESVSVTPVIGRLATVLHAVVVRVDVDIAADRSRAELAEVVVPAVDVRAAAMMLENGRCWLFAARRACVSLPSRYRSAVSR